VSDDEHARGGGGLHLDLLSLDCRNGCTLRPPSQEIGGRVMRSQSSSAHQGTSRRSNAPTAPNSATPIADSTTTTAKTSAVNVCEL
jgi:hypothetical protein